MGPEPVPPEGDGPPSPFEFVAHAPAPDLQPFVASLWYAEGTIAYRRERIAPTGSTVAVVVLADPIRQTPDDGRGEPCTADRGFVTGPHDRPVLNEPLGRTHAVGIVTTPVGCEAVLGVEPAAIRGRVAPLADHWPAADELRPLLLDAGSAAEALTRTERILSRHRRPPPPGFERCRTAVALLEADPTRAIADIAEQVGISHNRLDREFTRIVGMPPRALASLLRVRRLLADIDVQQPIDWAAWAAELGWYDQAHLIRDVKRYTGVSPTRYVDAQRRLLSADEMPDAAGFVPER